MNPQPTKQAVRHTQALPGKGSEASHDDLAQLVRTLVVAGSLDDPNAQGALAGLRAIASHGSPHFIAGEIQSIADRLPSKLKGGGVCKKDRAYGLAADLYLKDLLKEIAKLEAGERPIGPSILRDYCDEVVDCLFACEKVRRGVEVPLELVDLLLAKAVESATHRETYFALAVQALNSVRELSIQKLNRDAVVHRRATRSHMRGETPPPRRLSKRTSIDRETINYLNGLKQSLILIKEPLFQGDGPLALPGHELSREDDQNNLRKQYFYLQSLAKVAEATGYKGFAGWVHEQLGDFIRKWLQPAKGAPSLLEAAKDYERQGDIEQKLLLVQLSARRHRSAEELYREAGDLAGARRVRSKIADTQEHLPPFSIPLE